MFEGFTRFSSFGNRGCSGAGPKIRKGFKIQLTGRSEVWLNPNILNFASLDWWIFWVFRCLCTNIIVKIAGRGSRFCNRPRSIKKKPYVPNAVLPMCALKCPLLLPKYHRGLTSAPWKRDRLRPTSCPIKVFLIFQYPDTCLNTTIKKPNPIDGFRASHHLARLCF